MTKEEIYSRIVANPGIFQQEFGKNDGRNSRFLRQMERDGQILRVLTKRGVNGGSGAPGYRIYPKKGQLRGKMIKCCDEKMEHTNEHMPEKANTADISRNNTKHEINDNHALWYNRLGVHCTCKNCEVNYLHKVK